MYNYEDERTTIIPNICCFGFAAMFILVLFIAINGYLKEQYGIEILILQVLLIGIIIIPLLYIAICNIKNARYNRNLAQKIKDQGVKVKGEVVSVETTQKGDYHNSLFKKASFFRRKKISVGGGDIGLYHYAKVKYNYKNETYIIDTPYLDFYYSDLKNTEVDVYIYNNMCYVDNYKIAVDEISTRQKQNNKMKISIIVSFLITILVIGIIIYLHTLKVVDTKLLGILIPFIMISYFIVAISIYIRYILNKK